MTIKTDTKQKFYTKIHKIAKHKRFPLRAMFELTYRCNFNCPHCYVPHSYRGESERRDIKTKEVFSILDQLKDMNCFYLGFTGGEPFVREDILDILRYAKTRGFEIIIYTNGSLINRGMADELKKLKPNKVDITINSLKKGPFERITQTQGSYDRVFNAIDLLYRKKIPLGFKSCVLKENEDDVEDIREFAYSRSSLIRCNAMLVPELNGSKEPYKYRGVLRNAPQSEAQRGLPGGDAPRRSSVKPLRRGRRTVMDCEPVGHTKTAGLFKCGAGRSQVAITPFGELKICLMIDRPRYKILDTSLKRCWRNLRKFVASIRPDENYKCDECKFKTYCKWCPAQAWLEDSSFTSCVPLVI